MGRIERQILEEALRKAGGNKTAAAEMLGLKRTTLAAKLKPAPTAASTTVASGAIRPLSTASLRAIATEAAPVLPISWTLA